jgi:hypothetical protein
MVCTYAAEGKSLSLLFHVLTPQVVGEPAVVGMVVPAGYPVGSCVLLERFFRLDCLTCAGTLLQVHVGHVAVVVHEHSDHLVLLGSGSAL